jgi:hypothetical protein
MDGLYSLSIFIRKGKIMAENLTPDTRIVETTDNTSIFPTQQLARDTTSFYKDEDWVKQAFMVSDAAITDLADKKNRYYTSASMKFTSTKLGNNIGINARPGFTPYADIRQGRNKSVFKLPSVGSVRDSGMGRYYSEAIDDPSQTIFLRFGVPQFNGLLNFFARAYDANMTTLAKTGRGMGFFYNLGDAVGTFVGARAFPPIALAVFLGNVTTAVFGRPTTKFYTLKPTMHMYWSAVNILVNSIAINRGLLPKILRDGKAQKLGGQPFELDLEYLKEISALMPDMFTGVNGNANYIDSKAQRTANRVFQAEYEAAQNIDSAEEWVGYLKKRDSVFTSDLVNTGVISSLYNWVNSVLMTSSYFTSKSDNKNATSPSGDGPAVKESQSELDPRIDKDSKEGAELKESPPGFAEYFDAEFRQGSQFAVFKVDSTGSVSESFSNVTTESELSQKLNSTASQIRDIRFSMADGNLIDNFVTNTIGKVAGAAMDLSLGMISGVTFGMSDFLQGLASAGYIDIPKHWQNSNAKLPSGSYKMRLISPYGNVMSQMQNIYIPLCMILAGALPISAGRSAYASPMLCQLYDRGRCQIKLGIIESVSVTRGTSTLPFNTKGNALALDVSFNIVDLSSIMHMPLTTSGMFGKTIEMTLDDDNILTDYLAVLAGQDLYSQMFAIPKAKMRIAKHMLRLNRMSSMAEWSSVVHDTLTTGALSWTVIGNIVENMVGSSSVASGATNATRT